MSCAVFFEYAQRLERLPAVNITQPHKSSSVLRELFLYNSDSSENVDTLIRDKNGELAPYDLNAPAFVGWFNETVGSFEGKPVVLVGVGGVGEPIAKKVAAQHPQRLILIDPTDKTKLASSLPDEAAPEYHASLQDIANERLPGKLIVINAAGKEGATDTSGLEGLLTKYRDTGNVFVDIRPHLEIDIVERARNLGWEAHTGNGMNATNDHALLSGIADYLGVTPPPFSEFDELVKKAS